MKTCASYIMSFESEPFPSLFQQDEKGVYHVLGLRVQGLLLGSLGVSSICTHLLFFK